MHLFIQACILGLLAGGVYALMASGLTLAFGVMRVINVAQGAMIVLGAFLSYTLFTKLHIDPFVSVVLLTPLMFLVGVVLELVFIRPLRADEREELSLLVTWALALGIEGLLSVLYKTNYRSTITSYADKSWRVFGYHLSEVRVFAFGMSVVILTLLYLILSRTEFGRTVRATVQNPVSARLLGVNVDKVSALGFGISVATATAAGAVFGMVTRLVPEKGFDLLMPLLDRLLSDDVRLIILGEGDALAHLDGRGLVREPHDAELPRHDYSAAPPKPRTK